MKKLYYHVDVNNAFLSWEASYRLFKGDSIDIRNIPSVIAGDVKSRKGIVLAKSPPAKKYGIITGESIYSAKKKYSSLKVFPSNYNLYKKCSHALYTELYKYSNKVEGFSIDEYFVEITTENPIKLAYKIKDEIYKKLGFTVNIGISENKLLAKMASELKKPNMVHTIFKSEVKSKLWPLDVGQLFMVGRKTKEKLNKMGIYKIKELANSDVNLLKKQFGSHGILIHRYANGLDLSKINIKNKNEQKSIGNSTTIKKDIYDISEIKLYILAISEMVGIRVRSINKLAKTISVYYKDSNMNRYRQQRKFSIPTNSTNNIYDFSIDIFKSLWNNEGIRSIGITLDDLIDVENYQPTIFDLENLSIKNLDNSIDSIRKKYGEHIIKRASFINQDIPHILGGSGKSKDQLKLKSWL